ncbi:MAG: Gfo/Idh/MocA family oxidoreductase [Acidobacteria bacterium]|nr:Gfo/Idh/MocA family oxidoreductase [Acidobacteriota bacterium]
MGLHGRGRDHINAFSKIPGVQIAAVCDVDDQVLEAGARRVAGRGESRPKAFKDVRKLLEDPSIDAITIATPNHWHSLMAIWACQAGKDVFVEKPCSHNAFEARQIVEAARRYNRIVQHGTQCRSSKALRKAVGQLREGLIGDVYLARGLCFKHRGTIGRTPEEAVPSGLDYDLWLGPAPERPFTRNRFHYNWHWHWDYGNGDIGNQGIHELDVARWGLGVRYPTKVSSMGGHFLFDDDQETPNTQIAEFEFDDNGRKKMLVFEVRHWYSHNEAGIKEFMSRNTIGNLFYGSKGYMVVSGYHKYATFLGREQEAGPSGDEGGNHWQNFIDAVRSRRREDLHSEVEEGAVSSVLIHLANISCRLGRTVSFDAATLTCPGDAEATAMLTRNYRASYVVPGHV